MYTSLLQDESNTCFKAAVEWMIELYAEDVNNATGTSLESRSEESGTPLGQPNTYKLWCYGIFATSNQA